MAANALVEPGDPVLVAVSGGPDSMVLAEILRQYARRVGLAHCHFGLRAEADAEEALVRAFATAHGLALHVRRFDLGAEAEAGESTQMVARRVRYAFFEELCEAEGYGLVATAHHRDDEVETLLASFFRGRQPRLLQGIPLRRGRYVRPLHFAGKAEILAYAEAVGLQYAVDASNAAVKYQRNSIRNELLPALEKLNPSFRERLVEQYAEQELQFGLLEVLFREMEGKVVHPVSGGVKLDLAGFAALWPERFLPLFLTWFAHGLGFSGTEAREARCLLRAESGARFVGQTREMWRDRESIVFPEVGLAVWEPVEIAANAVFPLTLGVGDLEVVLERSTWSAADSPVGAPGTHVLDVDQIEFPLILRRWGEGDRMQPLGMQGRKKLSDILIDQKYSVLDKHAAVVLADQQEILFLSGFRIAEKVKITATTREVFRIRIRDTGQTT